MKLFNFEKETLTSYIEYELKTISKFKEPFHYVINGLIAGKNYLVIKSLDKFDLNALMKKEKQGKNYHWSVVTFENVTLVIRHYRYHFTIFSKVVKERDIKGSYVEYGAFTVNTDMKKFGKDHDKMMDAYYDKPFTDINVIFKDLISTLKGRDSGAYWVWNSAVLPRPKHVDIEAIFSGNTISSIDKFAFCMEEISQVYLELFAETTMLKRLKQIKQGDILNEHYKAGKINTEVKDDYFHDAGMELVDTKSKKKDFHDVYSLSRYHLKELFGAMYLYKGEVYIQNGEKPVVGEAAAYKDDEEEGNVVIFGEKYRPECFMPLKKF
jgi:hypothetical protein